MKSFQISFYILLLSFFLVACQNEKPAGQQSAEQQSVNTKPKTESSEAAKTLDVPWIAVYNDSTQLLEIKKNPVAHPANLNEQDIIDALNLKYPQIKLEVVSRDGNKTIVKIDDATYLTQQMGTAGARSYLAEATYSLTEIKGVEAVDFRFEPGDHAMPGILTRGSFQNFN